MNALFFIFFYVCKIEAGAELTKSKNQLPYFRRHVNKDSPAASIDESNTKLLHSFITNYKKIFNNIFDTINVTLSNNYTLTEASVASTTNKTMPKKEYTVLCSHNITEPLKSIISTPFEDIINYSFTNPSTHNLPFLKKFNHLTERIGPKFLPNHSMYFETDKDQGLNILDLVSEMPPTIDEMVAKRSCITCNNVEDEECSDPKNKLISAALCSKADDLCYSLHTPFGIVDRGCFSLKENQSTYVCSCNLCNFLALSEIPYVFSSKREWIDNVIDMSHMRQLKKSINKNMSCLSCEVTTTLPSGTNDPLVQTNCIEGSIGSLPTVTCKDNEVCGIKAIGNDGYIWRGCVETPVYNYWWTFCDSDLCNYDSLVSAFDE